MANSIFSVSRQPCEEQQFFNALRDGDLPLVKDKWGELKNDPENHDLSDILIRAGESYWGNSHVKDEEKYRIAQWIRAKESKLEGRIYYQDEQTSYGALQLDLYSAVSGLHLNDLYIAAIQIKKFLAKKNLSPGFFRPEWKKAKDIVQHRADSREKRRVLEIIDDALQRIDSKEVLFVVADRLRSWNLEGLSERVNAIADQATLFPMSSQTVESDWLAVKNCIDPNLSSEKRERAMSIISDTEERLQRGWNPACDLIEEFDDSCTY